MGENKLNELIDKTVGIKGNLQIPSYWMNKTLKDIINYVNTLDQDINFNVLNLLTYTSDLHNRLDRETNFKIVNESISYDNKLYISANLYTKFTLRSQQWPDVRLLSSAVDGVLSEYIIEVTCGTVNGTYSSNLVFDDTIKWENGERPSYEDNCVTLIKITNGLGSWQIFKPVN